MWNVTGIIVKRFWGLCAFLLITLAVLVSIGRELAPQVANYRPELENYFSELAGANVSISAIQARWRGLSPQLEMRGIQVHSLEGEALFSMEIARARVNLLHSLFARQLILDNLRFKQLDMGFLQNPDGSWALRGLRPRTSDASLALNDPLDIFLRASRIEVLDATLSLDFRTGHHTKLTFPSALLENAGDFHRLRSELAVDHSDVVSLIIEARGDPRQVDSFQAQGQLRLRNFDLDRVVAALPGQLWEGLPEQAWRQNSALNLDLWLNVAPGREITTHGTVDIGELPLTFDQGIQVPLRTTARFAGHWAESGAWKLALRDLNLLVEDVDLPALDVQLSSANLGEPVQVQVAEVDLAPWMAAILESGLVEGWALDSLRQLNPRGQLHNATFTVAGTSLDDIVIRASLHDVFLDSWRGAPAVELLNGYIEAKPLSGFVDLDSKNGFSMHYPTIYHQPLVFETARGRVHWNVDLKRKTVDVYSGLLAVDGAPGAGRGYFSLHIPMANQGGEELILQLGLRDSKAQYHKSFVPYVVPQPLLDWLDQSIGDGAMRSGGFLFRGGLQAATAEQATVQLFLNIEGAELAYHPDWPALQGANGVLWLDNQTVVADIDSARIFDTQVEEGHLRVHVDRGASSSTLEITAKGHGEARDGLRFLRETPLQTVIGGDWLEAWGLEGKLSSQVAITVPLDGVKKPEIHQIDLDLDQAVASNEALDLEFEALQGRLSFNDQRGLYAEKITGQLWGHAVNAELAEVHGDYRALTLTFKGHTDMAALQAWTRRPELTFASGAAAFSADLFVPYDGDHEQPRLTVSSDLEGVVVDLPAPYGKGPTESRTMTVGISLGAEDNLLELRYSDLAHAAFELKKGTLQRVAVGLGSNGRLPESGLLHVSGTVPQFDLAQWAPVLNRYQDAYAAESGGTSGQSIIPMQPVFDLTFDSFRFENFQVDQLRLRGEEVQDRWQISLDSPLVGGDVHLYLDPGTAILLNLTHLHLADVGMESGEGAAEDMLASFDPSGLPALDVNVDDFRIDGADFGNWSFQLRPTETGLIARNISGTVRGGHILGLTDAEGAVLEWQTTSGEAHTRFRGRFVTDNLGGVLEQWNQPHLLDSESSRFEVDLRWNGSPAAIAVTSLQGEVAMTVKRGSFTRGAGESSTGGALLELISFFNFDTWLRRIRLDFSDLKRSGMAFESIRGVLHFDEGRVIMEEPVVVNSFSSRFQMAGVVNLMDSSLDTRLVATIPVGGNLTFMAALSGFGLPAVAGMWLISKVFEEQIDKMSSLSFDVAGSLDDPKMKFVRFFDHEAVHEASRAQLDPQ